MNKKALTEMNVLIADDSRTNLLVLKELLKEIGFEDQKIITATDGQTAIETIYRNRKIDVNTDLIITDYRMPKLNGLNLVTKIKTDKRLNIPIIMSSGEDGEKFIKTAILSGVIGFIQKPYSITNIKEVISFILARPERRKFKTV